MLSAKQIWRTQLAEKVIVEKDPRADWDVKTRIVHYFMYRVKCEKPTDMMTIHIYGNYSPHIEKMIKDACEELCQQGVLAPRPTQSKWMYGFHSDMIRTIENIRKEATYH